MSNSCRRINPWRLLGLKLTVDDAPVVAERSAMTRNRARRALGVSTPQLPDCLDRSSSQLADGWIKSSAAMVRIDPPPAALLLFCGAPTYNMRIGTQTTSKNTILNRGKQKIIHQMINRLFGRFRQHFIWQCTCVISEPQKFLGNVPPTHPPIPPPPGFAAISATCVSYQITKTILGRKIFFPRRYRQVQHETRL